MTMLTEADSMGRTVDYLDFMLWVVRSDGNVDARQKTRLLSVMVEGMGLRDDLVERYREALALTEWPEPSDQQLKSLAEGLDPLSLGNLVRDAYLMAWADGVLREVEVNFVMRFLRVAGVPEERLPAIDKWAREAVDINRQAFQLFAR